MSLTPTLDHPPVYDPQKRCAPPKRHNSRLDAAIAKHREDAWHLKTWRDQVRARDEGKCRCCGVKTVRTLALHPKRGEAHHLYGRHKSVRYETRVGLHLCLRCHERVTGKVNDRLEIVGTVWFVKEGVKYINADYPVTFRKIA